MHKFKMTNAEYDQKLADQNGGCAICHRKPGELPPRRGKNSYLDIDHCHTTGKIRGALCYLCNAAIGHFKDDPALLRKAAEYLEKYL